MQKNSAIKIIFFGTSKFAVIQLEALVKHFTVVAVITAPDEPVGRKQILTPPPVKVFADTMHIPVLQPKKLDSDFIIQVLGFKPDIFIIAAYGKIIPKMVLDISPLGTLNVHPSLLPKWRGPSPIQYAILNGETQTGVTIMLVDEKMDHGPIISQITNHIADKKVTYPELHDELAKLGAELLIETLPKWINKEIKPIPQGEIKATYSKLLKKEDGKIDWSQPAEEIERKIRAFTPWPGTFTFWQRKQNMLRLYIECAKISDEKASDSVGVGGVFLNNNALCVKTGMGVLEFLQLQLEGKKSLDVKTFLNGYSDIVGSILE